MNYFALQVILGVPFGDDTSDLAFNALLCLFCPIDLSVLIRVLISMIIWSRFYHQASRSLHLKQFEGSNSSTEAIKCLFLASSSCQNSFGGTSYWLSAPLRLFQVYLS
jgi:hypothetical protein